MVHSDDAIARGREALRFFHNYAVAKYRSNYGFSSLDELVGYFNSERPAMIEAYGRMLLENGVSDIDLSNFMKKLVDAGEGGLPKKWSIFYNVIEPKSWGMLDTFEFVVSETASDAIEGAAKIGDTAVGALKFGIGLAPIALAGALLLYVFVRAKTV